MAVSNIAMIKKLQKAINLNGGNILYNTTQFYSKAEDRPITIYVVKQAIWDEEKRKHINVELFSSTSQIQVVLFLRDFWYELNGWELPQDNEYWNQAKAAYYSRKSQNA